MSLSTSVQVFKDKELYKFKRSSAWNIFGSKCSPPRLLGYDLTYDGRYGGFLYLDEDEFIDGCGVQSASDNAVRDLYAVARQVPSAISHDDAFFVADAAFLVGVPDWLSAALPKPIRVVHDADELIQFLWQG